MGLRIGTTGLEQYSPSGEGRVKALIIGGPGTGKTRWSSFFPKPIFLDCEGGLASVADRRVQYVTISNSNDMLEALNYLKVESRRKPSERDFRTVVVDTLDAFQRKVKDEWLQAHPNESSFRGFEAWGYLETKMQALTTRLLNLDMNVIVAVHFTEKTISEGSGDNKTDRQEFQLQLSGAIKDQVFNDFDLVGWMGTYFELDRETNSRVQRRGLTFKPTPDKPFLKDRLHVTPSWMEVQFSDEDYATLFAAVTSRLDDLPESEEFGVIPDGMGDPFAPTSGVLAPLAGGALPPQDPREIPLAQHDKPTLMKMARDAGLDVKGNTLKGELVNMLEAHRATPTAPAEPAAESSAPGSGDAGVASTSDLPKETLANYAQASRAAPAAASAPAEAAARPSVIAEAPPAVRSATEVPVAPPTDETPAVLQTPEGPVDTATGELLPPSEPEAIENAVAGLGGKVVSQTERVDVPVEASVPVPVAAPSLSASVPANDMDECGGVCMADVGGTRCTNSIGPNPDFIKLSFIKYRKHYCDSCYLARKKAS